MVVLLIMAVAAAMVAPSLFRLGGASAEDEADRLARVLGLAMDEAALGGRGVRWRATRRAWWFETRDAEGRWRKMSEPPLARHALPEGVEVRRVRPAPPARERGRDERGGRKARLIGEARFTPAGLDEPVRIDLASGRDCARVRLSPGDPVPEVAPCEDAR